MDTYIECLSGHCKQPSPFQLPTIIFTNPHSIIISLLWTLDPWFLFI